MAAKQYRACLTSDLPYIMTQVNVPAQAALTHGPHRRQGAKHCEVMLL